MTSLVDALIGFYNTIERVLIITNKESYESISGINRVDQEQKKRGNKHKFKKNYSSLDKKQTKKFKFKLLLV